MHCQGDDGRDGCTFDFFKSALPICITGGPGRSSISNSKPTKDKFISKSWDTSSNYASCGNRLRETNTSMELVTDVPFDLRPEQLELFDFDAQTTPRPLLKRDTSETGDSAWLHCKQCKLKRVRRFGRKKTFANLKIPGSFSNSHHHMAPREIFLCSEECWGQYVDEGDLPDALKDCLGVVLCRRCRKTITRWTSNIETKVTIRFGHAKSSIERDCVYHYCSKRCFRGFLDDEAESLAALRRRGSSASSRTQVINSSSPHPLFSSSVPKDLPAFMEALRELDGDDSPMKQKPKSMSPHSSSSASSRSAEIRSSGDSGTSHSPPLHPVSSLPPRHHDNQSAKKNIVKAKNPLGQLGWMRRM